MGSSLFAGTARWKNRLFLGAVLFQFPLSSNFRKDVSRAGVPPRRSRWEFRSRSSSVRKGGSGTEVFALLRETVRGCVSRPDD